jgi:hypothetical protein
MQIGFSEEQYQNAASGISARWHPDSNVKKESDEHSAKHSFSRNATEAGIPMESRKQH